MGIVVAGEVGYKYITWNLVNFYGSESYIANTVDF